jgi:hypothetical protein
VNLRRQSCVLILIIVWAWPAAACDIVKTGQGCVWYNPLSTATYHVNDAVPFSHYLSCSARRTEDCEDPQIIVVYFKNGYDTSLVDSKFWEEIWGEDQIDERYMHGSPYGTHAFGSTGSHGSWAKITYNSGSGEMGWSVNFPAFWSNGFNIVP